MTDFQKYFGSKIAKLESLTGNVFLSKKGIAINSDTLYSKEYSLSTSYRLATSLHDIDDMPIQFEIYVRTDGQVIAQYNSCDGKEVSEMVQWWVDKINYASNAGYRLEHKKREEGVSIWKSL